MILTDNHKGVRQLSSARHRVQDPEHHVWDDLPWNRSEPIEQIPNEAPWPETVLPHHGGDREETEREDRAPIGRGREACRVAILSSSWRFQVRSCPYSFFPRAFLSLGFARLRDVISGLATDRKHDFLWVDEHEPTTSNVSSFEREKERERERHFLCSWFLWSCLAWPRTRRAFIYANDSKNEKKGHVSTCHSLKIFNRSALFLSIFMEI